MQNDVANNTASLTTRHNDQDTAAHGICPRGVRVHRTWFFWSFVLIPVLVILGWTEYVSTKGPVPWLGIGDMQHAGHWSEWMRYYIWLQLVWLPANMVIFLIWCALGVRIWNCKKTARGH